MPRDLLALLLLTTVAACGSDSSGPAAPARTYRMGFSALPPRPDTALVLPTLTLATQHSDAALIQLGIPWTVLLDGIPAATEVRVVRLPLADYYRGVGQAITVASVPEDIPLDYYARLVQGRPLAELVLESGWPSVAAGGVNSTPEIQARYIRRHAQILDAAGAAAAFQISFTDLDLTGWPVPSGSVLPLFAHLGLVDSVLQPKPALAVWDSVLAVDLKP